VLSDTLAFSDNSRIVSARCVRQYRNAGTFTIVALTWQNDNNIAAISAQNAGPLADIDIK
jgi:hypothetical protein